MTTEEEQDKGRLRRTLRSARERVGQSVERATGAEFRRQFEEFTDVVTTTVLGIHRDQEELRARLSSLESSKLVETSQPDTPTKLVEMSRPGTSKLVVAALAISLSALVLSVVALIRAGL